MTPIPPAAFSMELLAEPQHIDELGHVNNVVWVDWIQHVATAHWRARASADDQARYIWYVVRHEIDYHRAMLVGERAIAHTWAADHARGAKFDRHMVFLDSGGKALISSITTWAMIDRDSGRPVRVPASLIDQFSGGAAARPR